MELQGWLPSIITACSVVAMFVTMREQVKQVGKRLASVERKLNEIGDHERLKTDVFELQETVREIRDAMLRSGDLAPRARARSSRTPVRGVPVPPQIRESDEEV